MTMNANTANDMIDESDLIPIDKLRAIAESLKCMAHPHRLRVIQILSQGEQTVERIAQLCQLSQPATSGHLRLMEGKGILKCERRGRMVFYQIADPHAMQIIESFQPITAIS